MEQAVLLTDLEQLSYLHKRARQYSRLYFGSEFCPLKLPQTSVLYQIIDFCQNSGLSLTLMTPFLPQKSFKDAAKLLNHLLSRNVYPEIIVNDWGFLNYIHTHYEGKFPLLAGRLCAKQKTGPRIELIKATHPAAYASSKKCHLDVPELLKFLKSHGVVRMEMDVPLQGIDLCMQEEYALPVSLHLPYTYISTTRRCPAQVGEQCFCRGSSYILKSAGMLEKLYVRGNTVFLKHETEPSLQEYSFADRIVFSPFVP